MRFFTATLFLAAAGFVVAQCPAQDILDACISTETPQREACAVQDWECLCTQTENILTCYNNCPGDPGRAGVESQRTAYCTAAKSQITTTTTSAVPTTFQSATVSSAPAQTGGVTSAAGSSSDTGKTKAKATTDDSAASGLVIPSSAILSLLLGAVALI